MKKTYNPDFNTFILEGKYNSITREITKEIFQIIKVAYSLYSVGAEDQLGEKDKEDFYTADLSYWEKPVETEVSFRIKFDDSLSSGFSIDGGSWNEDKDSALIEISVSINPKKVPAIFSTLNGFIQDAVRHEIEHLTQGGLNKLQNKAKPTRSKIRDKIKYEIGSAYKYFILRDEIPAMVQGMYKKAKIEKITLDKSFDIYLDYMIDNKVISQKEKIKILKEWFKFAKKNLPTAQYSEKYSNILNKIK